MQEVIYSHLYSIDTCAPIYYHLSCKAYRVSLLQKDVCVDTCISTVFSIVSLSLSWSEA